MGSQLVPFGSWRAYNRVLKVSGFVSGALLGQGLVTALTTSYDELGWTMVGAGIAIWVAIFAHSRAVATMSGLFHRVLTELQNDIRSMFTSEEASATDTGPENPTSAKLSLLSRANDGVERHRAVFYSPVVAAAIGLLGIIGAALLGKL